MISFGSVLVSLLCIYKLYLTLTSWCHLLTRQEPWNQSFVKDMECLRSLARLLAKEKTDMNTHQKIARSSALQAMQALNLIRYTHEDLIRFLLALLVYVEIINSHKSQRSL